MTAVHTQRYAVATANPLATQAACEVLRDGRHARPTHSSPRRPSSGWWSRSPPASAAAVSCCTTTRAPARCRPTTDARSRPAAATENYLRWVVDTDRTEPQPDARASGRSIGVPGIVRMLADVHGEHGSRPWRDLFAPAVTLADDGFEISDRLATAIADAAPRLRIDEEAAAYFLETGRQPETGRHHADQSGLCEDVGRHRHRPGRVLHRPDRPRHRRRRRRPVRRTNPGPADRRGSVGYTRTTPGPAVHPLPGLRDLRDAAPVVRRDRRGGHPRDPGALPDGRGTDPPRWTSTADAPR